MSIHWRRSIIVNPVGQTNNGRHGRQRGRRQTTEEIMTTVSENMQRAWNETVLNGRNASLADGVQRALGREPRDFADYARETAASGVWDVSALVGAR
jgi:hypothetical protein